MSLSVCAFFLLAVYFEMMKKWKLLLLIIWLFILIVPVLWGYLREDSNNQFSGLIFNPIDGYSYYAKMMQGKYGSWTFNLPYSAETNSEIFIFTLYSFFGHISRVLGTSILFLYHFFRMVFAVFIFFLVEKLLNKIYIIEDKYYKGAFISLLFGGGMGWLFMLSGNMPVDFWVAESFIFLSTFSNPHFVLSFVIILTILNIIISNYQNYLINLLLLGLSILLVSISPFAAVMMSLLLGMWFLLNLNKGKFIFINVISFSLPTLIIGLYQYLTIQRDPILNLWNNQNVTTTPSIINLIFSFSPFILGILFFSILLLIKKVKFEKFLLLLLFWVGFSFVMAYIPFNLQRRFLVGIYIPITLTFWYLLRLFLNYRYSRRTKFIIILSICLVLPSNLLIFSGSVNAINNQDQIFFIDKGLVNSITWLTRNHSHGDVILADVENGLKIPALGPFKVVYGHPFESIDADQTEQSVNDFWSGKMSISESENFFSEYKVDLILCEYKNNVDECPITKDNHKIIYDVDKFAIFQVPN